MKNTMWYVLAIAFVLSCAERSFGVQEQEAMKGQLQVADAKLGKGVMDREIMDEESSFLLNEKVYLWMKVTGGSADSLTVTWKHNEHSYTIKLAVSGNPWRTWAYKTAAHAGEWTVTVADREGNVLKEMSFVVEGMKK